MRGRYLEVIPSRARFVAAGTEHRLVTIEKPRSKIRDARLHQRRLIK